MRRARTREGPKELTPQTASGPVTWGQITCWQLFVCTETLSCLVETASWQGALKASSTQPKVGVRPRALPLMMPHSQQEYITMRQSEVDTESQTLGVLLDCDTCRHRSFSQATA